MEQEMIGKFISSCRKEKGLTQMQLAEKLNITNRAVSKWETGKCMPDYSIIESLCTELNTTLAELMNGEEDDKSIHTYDNEQIVEMMKEMQELKKAKITFTGYILIIVGIVMLTLSLLFGGTEFQDFLSGFMLGLSICQMVVGIFVVSRQMANKNGSK